MTVDVRKELPDNYKFGWEDKDAVYRNVKKKGLSEDVVREISQDYKHEPDWMFQRRLKALKHYRARTMPTWGADLSGIDFEDIYYYLKASDSSKKDWNDVPAYVKSTFDKLGIPEAEQKYLSGVGAQYDSESVYHNIRKDLEKLGVIFMDTDTALKEHEDIVKQYFGTVIPANDNKLAALNTAVWSGGSFVWVPPGVEVTMPLQAYFRINSENAGQFERTLIIAEPGSKVHYVEGCTAPVFTTNTLHSAVVEIIVKEGADVRYTTIQNWSHNVYNLVTKRAVVQKGGRMSWIDANLSKGISKGSGIQSYRGLVKIYAGSHGAKSTVRCDALMLDDTARSSTYPYMEIDEDDVTIGHEASVSKVGEEQLFYLMSRGLSEADATAMVVNGFIEPIVKTLPMDYAIEMNRLIQLQMQGAIG